jgi:hypothetical protein
MRPTKPFAGSRVILLALPHNQLTNEVELDLLRTWSNGNSTALVSPCKLLPTNDLVVARGISYRSDSITSLRESNPRPAVSQP